MDRSELLGDAYWGHGLAELVLVCPSATEDDELSLLRMGHAAVMRAAALHPGLFPGLLPAARFEAMLMCGASESAALSLVPQHAGFLLSRGPNGRHIGSVFMPECGEYTAEGNTAALTVMAAALASCHAQLARFRPPAGLLN